MTKDDDERITDRRNCKHRFVHIHHEPYNKCIEWDMFEPRPGDDND